MEGFLNAEYIGKNSDSALDVSQLMKYYKTTMDLDGKDVVVYLGQEFNMFEDGKKPLLFVIGWLDENDARVNQIYTKSSDRYNFKLAPKTISTEIDLSQVQVYLPKNYESEPITPNNEQKKGKNKLRTQLFQMKKSLILSKRKEQFIERLSEDEEVHPGIKIENILSKLNDKEKAQAENLHDKMVKCVMMGKYPYKCYTDFMKNLINIIKKDGYVVSAKDRKEMQSFASKRKSQTFKVPNNKFIARFCNDENHPYLGANILDIDFGIDSLYCYNPNSYHPREKSIRNKKDDVYIIDQEECYQVSTDGTFIVFLSEDGEVRYILEREKEFLAKAKKNSDISDMDR